MQEIFNPTYLNIIRAANYLTALFFCYNFLYLLNEVIISFLCTCVCGSY
jgi:hypothetical protein